MVQLFTNLMQCNYLQFIKLFNFIKQNYKIIKRKKRKSTFLYIWLHRKAVKPF